MPFHPDYGCLPPVCVKVLFDARNAFIVSYPAGVANPKKAKGKAIDALYKAELTAFKASLKDVRLGCDGDCACVILNPNAPWTAVPEQQIGTFDDGKGIVAVDGVQAKCFMGTCVHKSTLVKPDGDRWMKAEDHEKKYFPKAPRKKKKRAAKRGAAKG